MTKSHASPSHLYHATTRTLAAILGQYSEDARPGFGATAEQCMAGIARLNNPQATDQAILAFRGLIGLVDPDPIASALASLEVDGVCGRQCQLVASLIDAMINNEKQVQHPASNLDD